MNKRNLHLMIIITMIMVLGSLVMFGNESAIAETDNSQGASFWAELLNGGSVYLPIIMKNYDPTVTFDIFLPVILKEEISIEPSEWDFIMTENFEGVFPSGDWEIPTSDYAWAKRECRGHLSSSNSAWAVGGGTAIPVLDCNVSYPDNVDTRMKYGPFSLEGVSQAELVYWQWLNIHVSDEFQVLASINNVDFYGDIPIQGSTGGWEKAVFDLTAVPTLGDLTGQSQVWIAYDFRSDSVDTLAHGAYLDDIVLQTCDGSCTPTTITSNNLEIMDDSDTIK